MKALDTLLRTRPPSQLYYYNTPTPVGDVARVAVRWGFRLFYINGEQVADTDDFFAQAKSTMAFPWFGWNYDALYDCMRDMSWFKRPAFVLLFDDFQQFARSDPDRFTIALDVLYDIPEFYRQRTPERRFYILLRGDAGVLTMKIPSLGRVSLR